jgi:hypothetical protein
VSAGHATQTDEEFAATIGEYVPAPHNVQEALPLLILYVPLTQALHGPP